MPRAAPRFRISIRQDVRPAPFHGNLLRRLVRRAVKVLAVEGADLRILVVEDAEMERCNRTFLGRAGTTTVISFPEDETGSAPPSRLAGDILLSARACLSRTKNWPCSEEEKVFYFIVHGVLHLLGYDHEKGKAGAARMRREEIRVYRSCLKEGRSPI
ncbi:MAG: rRNA maturation RNase YbeY [Deltaproteobacteria bacterium]|nr:rRNA maturation RNase YbeY [Deltaproteobacteria bacterium]